MGLSALPAFSGDLPLRADAADSPPQRSAGAATVQEQGQAKNSVALLRLSLARCELVVGERFAAGALQA